MACRLRFVRACLSASLLRPVKRSSLSFLPAFRSSKCATCGNAPLLFYRDSETPAQTYKPKGALCVQALPGSDPVKGSVIKYAPLLVRATAVLPQIRGAKV